MVEHQCGPARAHQRGEMNVADETPSLAAIEAAYTWAPGSCYRCRRQQEKTAVVGRLPTLPQPAEVRACLDCVLILEYDRERAAHRYGWPYVPGEQAPAGP
jgi:hypothetical protein